MANRELAVFDGVKMASLSQLVTRPEAWTRYTPTISETETDIEAYSKAVPWLFRGIELRANAVAALPFALVTDGGEEYDTSDDWQNRIGFLPNPEPLLWLIEACLTALPEAYVFRSVNRVKTLELRFLLASSIEPVIDEVEGLLGFTRQVGAKTYALKPEELLYFWRSWPFTEAGPATDAAPAAAALAAAGVLYNLDEFAAKFFERGAIKATLLKVGGIPPEKEKKRLKAWWKRVFSGIDNAWTARIVSTDTEVEVIGEGIKELADIVHSRQDARLPIRANQETAG